MVFPMYPGRVLSDACAEVPRTTLTGDVNLGHRSVTTASLDYEYDYLGVLRQATDRREHVSARRTRACAVNVPCSKGKPGSTAADDHIVNLVGLHLVECDNRHGCGGLNGIGMGWSGTRLKVPGRRKLSLSPSANED